MKNSFIVLGIESSCDDTAAALINVYHDGYEPVKTDILSSVIIDQLKLHSSYGGVVPELAARAHSEKLDFCVEQAIVDSGLKINDIDVIAVTSGPGLIGGLFSGVLFSKGLSLGLGKPLVGVNHLAGHALTARLIANSFFPYLTLLVSGGHCQLLVVESPTTFIRLGGTLDDSPGEAFDKTAKLLGLGYPGGPKIQERAKTGDPNFFELPKPLCNQDNCNLSFSGLKTAVRRESERLISKQGLISDKDISNLCASFQKTVADILVEKTKKAMDLFSQNNKSIQVKQLAVVGGVAANEVVRSHLKFLAKNEGFQIIIPPTELCTDNAVMIAYTGAELFVKKSFSDSDLICRPRWPLDKKAMALLGSGKKGVKG